MRRAWALAALAEPVRGLPAARRQTRTLGETAHRPWPLPERPWVMGQTWERLLFAHWSVGADELRRVVPAALPLDAHDGRHWGGGTPVVVAAMHPRGLPPPPAGSRFAELNVRTYVTVDGKPGIWFLSLDAASRLAVTAARRTYRLPYLHARMGIERLGNALAYGTRRTEDGDARLEVRYRPPGDRLPVTPS